MKKIFLLLLSATVFIACEGDQGPPGFDGQDGGIFVAQSYEVTRNLTAPDYAFNVLHPSSVEVFDTDMILVYLLIEEAPTTGGGTIDVWSLLPQTFYADFGEYAYNYESTAVELDVFLDGPLSTDFNLLPAAATDNQTFRIVILPVDFANDPTLDITDYNSVMQVTGLGNSDFIKIE